MKDADISSVFDDVFLVNMCQETCKHWCFQLEQGEGGLIHYQMRIHLIKKVRKRQCLTFLTSYVGAEYIDFLHISPTSKNEADFYSYVNKKQSRIGQPHSDKDDGSDTKVMTTQLRQFNTFELRPYQKMIKELIQEHKKTPDFRSIYFIQDVGGSIGKSVFAEYLEYNDLCEELPLMNSMEDISSWIASSLIDKDGKTIGQASSCYLIDIPRSKNEDKINGFLAGVEQVKDGKAFDKRYRARKIRFNRPMVICFCNAFPNSFEGLTRNRWKCYTINENYEMIRYQHCPSLVQETLQNIVINDSQNDIFEISSDSTDSEYIPDKLDNLV